MIWINDCLQWIFRLLLIVKTANCICELQFYAGRIIQSHNHHLKRYYDNNNNCSVVLTASEGKLLTLRIFYFKLEWHNTCQYDFLKIYDGNTTKTRLIGTYCGSRFPGLLTSTSQQLLLHFRTDRSNVYKGFKGIAVAREIDRNCVRTQNEIGVFKLRYKFHGRNILMMDCTWTITGIRKRIIEISRSSSRNNQIYESCNLSHVKIYKKNGDGQFTHLYNICHDFRRTLPDMSDEIVINMHVFAKLFAYTHWNGVFTVNISQANEQSCNTILTDTMGTFASPNRDGNGNYGPLEECSWVITARSDYRVTLHLHVIEVEEENHYIQQGCNRDYIMVYDGDTLKGRYCENKRQIIIKSNTNKLHVIFHTDQYGQYQGFNATYKQTKGPECKEHLTNQHGSIQLPVNESGYYSNDLNCEWVINSRRNNRIQLRFEFFDIDCRNNSLEITDGNGKGRDTSHFCGNTTPPDITTNTSHVKLHFRSGSMYSGRGFKLTYRIFQDKSPYIKVKQEKLKWAEAAKKCEETNEILAIPRNEQEMEAIQMALVKNEKAWIGSYSTFTPWSSAMDCYRGNHFPVLHLKENSIASCFELCQANENILLQDDICSCVDPSKKELHGTKVNYSLCNKTCPGSYSELCGGSDAYLHYKADTKLWPPEDYDSDCAYIEVPYHAYFKENPKELKFDKCSSVHRVICKMFDIKRNEIFSVGVNYTTRYDAMQICQELGGILVDTRTLFEDYNQTLLAPGSTYWVNMKRTILKNQLVGAPDSIKARNYRCLYVDKDTQFYDIKSQDCSTNAYFVCRNDSLELDTSTLRLAYTERSNKVLETTENYLHEVPAYPATVFNRNINKYGQISRSVKEEGNPEIDYDVVIAISTGTVVLLGLIITVIIFIRKRKDNHISEKNRKSSIELNQHHNVKTSDPALNEHHGNEGANVTMASTKGMDYKVYNSLTASGGARKTPIHKVATTVQEDLYNGLSSTKTKSMCGAELDDTYDHAGIPPNEDIYHKLNTAKSYGVTSHIDDIYDHVSAPPNVDDEYHKLDIRNPKHS